jgi:hypothetical protein
MERAGREFDVLVTMDASLSFQRDLTKYQIAVVVLKAPSNRLADTRPLMSRVLALLPTLKPGTLTIVSAQGSHLLESPLTLNRKRAVG